MLSFRQSQFVSAPWHVCPCNTYLPNKSCCNMLSIDSHSLSLLDDICVPATPISLTNHAATCCPLDSHSLSLLDDICVPATPISLTNHAATCCPLDSHSLSLLHDMCVPATPISLTNHAVICCPLDSQFVSAGRHVCPCNTYLPNKPCCNMSPRQSQFGGSLWLWRQTVEYWVKNFTVYSNFQPSLQCFISQGIKISQLGGFEKWKINWYE